MWTVLTLLACGGEPTPEPTVAPITADEASAAVADILCRTADQAQLRCTHDGATVELADTRLTTHAQVLEFVPIAPRTIGGQLIPGEVKLTLKIGLSREGQALTALDREVTEAVGRTDLDEARADTLEAAVQTWAVAHGLAMIDALAQAPDAPSLASVGIRAPAQKVGPFMAWGAHPVLRSTSGPVDAKTASKFGPSVVSLLAALEPFTEVLDPEDVHSIEVKARLNTADAPCSVLPSMTSAMSGQTVKSMPLAGELLVDGQPTGDICALVESVDWPRPSPGSALLWDQFVVLAPAVQDEAPAGASD